MKKKIFELVRELWFCLLPCLGTAVLLMAVFHKYGLYPFGEGSVAWCDMSQQSVPLFADLKDVLDGKESLFLNMKNAGGMNFWGVFGFFLSSPLNLFVKFVDKSRIPQFMNILVTTKLSLCSLTACIYFRLCHKRLNRLECSVFAVMYGLCAYGLMYYQNQMWLDVMYLFPLLMVSAEHLFKKGRNLPYIVLLSMTLICNFYLSFMVGVYVIVFVSGYFIFVKKDQRSPEAASRLISGTVLSFMITAFVWLPSYIETKQSIRMKSAVETISETHFLSNYETAIPLIYGTAFIFAAVGVNIFVNKVKSEQERFSLFLFIMTLLPVFFEPINLTWHTGNYMSFVTRYGFATIFSGLRLCAVYLERDGEELSEVRKKLSDKALFAVLAGVMFVVYGFINLSERFMTTHWDKLTHYTSAIYGDKDSLDKLSALFLFAVLCYGAVYFIYKKGLFDRTLLGVVLAVMVAFESFGNAKIYIGSAYEKNTQRSNDFISLMELSEQFDGGDGLYRVMTDGKVTDYNTIGAMGLNTLGHYTSLTDKEFMFQQKRLGYTSVWVETGTGGGSELTDALYGVKYRIYRGEPTERTLAAHNGFRIDSRDCVLSPAIVTDRSILDKHSLPEDGTRADIQKYLFGTLFGGDAVTVYEPETNGSFTKKSDGFFVSGGTELLYKINVTGRQTLYADCFGNYSNNLSEGYFDGLSVSLNGETFRENYPTKTENGFLCLGTFDGGYVEVRLKAKKNLDVGSLGVFAVDMDKLETAVSETQSAELSYKGGKMQGSVTAESGRACLLTVPYSKGFSVKVNGRRVACERVLSDFIAFELDEGENDIRISFVPPAFIGSAVISAAGLAAAVFLVIFTKKKKAPLPEKLNKLSEVLVYISAAAGMFIVYIYPVLLNLHYIPE